eukprot:SAG31_NODE_1905_length_6952_cov_4.685685_8_plen_84_part_00
MYFEAEDCTLVSTFVFTDLVGSIVNNYNYGLGANAMHAAMSGANDFLQKSAQQVDFAQWCVGVGNLIRSLGLAQQLQQHKTNK